MFGETVWPWYWHRGLSILELPGTKWNVKEIARRFFEYYLLHTDRRGDYEYLAGYPQPEQFPLSKVISMLNAMPLHFLSNKEGDFFLLNKKAGQFQGKPQLAAFWDVPAFKSMVKERLEFGLFRYFDRIKVKNALPQDSVGQ